MVCGIELFLTDTFGTLALGQSISILNSKACNSLALLLARHGNSVATCWNDAFRDNLCAHA